MDLFRLEDLERNSQIIVPGYGLQYQADVDDASRRLQFTRMNMYIKNESISLNITIYYKNTYSNTCKGSSK